MVGSVEGVLLFRTRCVWRAVGRPGGDFRRQPSQHRCSGLEILI